MDLPKVAMERVELIISLARYKFDVRIEAEKTPKQTRT